MKRIISALIFGLACGSASAHELTPTYPDFKRSYIEGVSVTTMQLFNSRQEVEYFLIEVFTENWTPIPFATGEQTIKVSYQRKKTFDVYVRTSDLPKVEFICTTSRLLSQSVESTGVSSRICSRVK